ncbi:DUF2332 domain-containing protein [Hoeflea sp.]|uniref:DUF2332 domain-containing protein n=1 Tax=Hoeflea sp. TaxID=1940281 RepID=UPI003B026524
MSGSILPETVRRAFALQQQACDRLGSPFTAQLCGTIAEHGLPVSRVHEVVSSWPGDPSANGDSVPLRLCGALHEIVLSDREDPLAAVYPPNHVGVDSERFFAAVSDAVRRHDVRIRERLRLAPQTNEIRRSTAVYAALLHISEATGKPVVLSEVGASAGLNLLLDRFEFDLAGADYGNNGSAVRLSTDWSGPPPPAAQLSIAERRGCDLSPFDLSSQADRLRLLSYVWPDQTNRLDRISAALALHDEQPVMVDAADAVSWLGQRLSGRYHGSAHVIYHTIAWQYLPEKSRRQGQVIIEAAGAKATPDAPLFLLGLEADGNSPGAALTLRSWPGGIERELARVDFHGRWIRWNPQDHDT